MTDFNSKSTDAMFAKVLTEIEGMKTQLDRIELAQKHTDTEVATLKNWQENIRGRVAVIAVLFGSLGTVVGTTIAVLIEQALRH